MRYLTVSERDEAGVRISLDGPATESEQRPSTPGVDERSEHQFKMQLHPLSARYTDAELDACAFTLHPAFVQSAAGSIVAEQVGTQICHCATGTFLVGAAAARGRAGAQLEKPLNAPTQSCPLGWRQWWQRTSCCSCFSVFK